MQGWCSLSTRKGAKFLTKTKMKLHMTLADRYDAIVVARRAILALTCLLTPPLVLLIAFFSSSALPSLPVPSKLSCMSSVQTGYQAC